MYRLIEDPEKIQLECTPTLRAKLPQNAEERHQLLDGFFTKHYEKIDTCFREHIIEFFREIASFSDIIVISNSGTTRVEQKLALLKEKNAGFPKIRVVGNAEKFQLKMVAHLNPIPALYCFYI